MVLSIIIGLLPVITQMGLLYIKYFGGNAEQQALAQKQYLNAINNAADCVKKSMEAKTAFDAAQAELDAMDKKP